jgi:hypothetical protein
MNWLPVLLLFVTAWLAIFVQTQFTVVLEWLGLVPSLIPALMVHAALTHSTLVITSLALFAGLSLDALSPMKVGYHFVPLLILGWAIQTRQGLILRDQAYARVFLGLAAGVFIPLSTLLLLTLGDRPVIAGWNTAWHLVFSGLFNAVCCPICFAFFDSLERILGDPRPIESSFRPDRQIKRGRH